MTIREIILPTGEKALEIDTEEEFGEALETDLPLLAPPEVAAAFGLPDTDEGFGHDHTRDDDSE